MRVMKGQQLSLGQYTGSKAKRDEMMAIVTLMVGGEQGVLIL